jgi:hypothetical protein
MFDSPIRFCVQAEARSYAILKDLQNYRTSARPGMWQPFLINPPVGATGSR